MNKVLDGAVQGDAKRAQSDADFVEHLGNLYGDGAAEVLADAHAAYLIYQTWRAGRRALASEFRLFLAKDF